MSQAPDHVFRELRDREPIFHRPELGTSRRDFEEMTDRNFWEVVASGRVYSHSFVLEELERRHAAGPVEENWQVEDCECTALGDGVYLFTYQLNQGQRISRRATLWRRAGDGWKALYHQGTLVSS
ncbi:MAG: DUF4440 domain-containing protein [Pseudomonadota bacterium]|nr:DUF4440 domain-containing protein [Pseudomonadota bacterium]